MLPTANLLLTYLLTICQGGPLLANRAACPNPTRNPTPNPNLNPNQVNRFWPTEQRALTLPLP